MERTKNRRLIDQIEVNGSGYAATSELYPPFDHEDAHTA
jgi:hypothetical protein